MRSGRLIALLLPLLAAGLLVSVSPAGGALDSPTPTMPSNGASGAFLPAFGWNAVSGAARYEFEIAADPGFNSPVLGSNFDHFFTRNTRATLTKVVPNGTYWWHVRSVASNGAVSGWSPARSFTRAWASQPTLQSPADGATISFPAEAFRLSWTPVAGAVKYAVSVATDPALGTVVWSTHEPIVTQATTFTLSSPLAPDQTYYWGVTPIDAGGNKGTASEVRSFEWEWPSTTTPTVTDIATDPEIYDPEFSWTPVAGAAGYELEVSTSVDFASGSRVCCTVNGTTNVTTIGTTYTPPLALQNNNAYYWRVRAIDASRNAGVWNVGPQFSKDFDGVLPSVTNLHMVDNPTPGDPGFETDTPIVEWAPVPGASAYEVEVTRYAGGCQWSANTEHWNTKTATTAWTPLGTGWNGVKPYNPTTSPNVSTELPSLVSGHSYCVRVTALDRPSNLLAPYIRSLETYLPDANHAAFTWTGPPTGNACSPSCNPGALGSGDYLTPIGGVTKTSMPYFRWKPLAGYESYFVLVSRDPNFSNVIDYAFTKVSAYAPRTGFAPVTYPDETNLYYWAVLPSTEANGSGVVTAPQFSEPQSFLKQSVPPTLLSPANGATLSGPVRFRWAPALGARRYQLQVSTDPTFSSSVYLLSDIQGTGTDSTAYTSSVPFAADTALYWRVRADDELGTGLTWSATGTFRKLVPAPVPLASNPTSGDSLPNWGWSPVPGAVSYDVVLTRPDGFSQTFARIPSNVATPTLMKGTGIWKLRAAANFPQVNSLALTRGPFSPDMSFTRTIHEPADPSEEIGASRVVLSWDPQAGAQNYRVQISTREDFSQLLFDAPTTTDNPTYAPWLSSFAYSTGGTFYWRVAAADDIATNAGDFTATQVFTIPPLPSSTTTTKATTTTTVAVTKTKSKIKAHGTVFPGHSGKKVRVTLYKKRKGSFVKVATRSPLLGATGYSTSFSRPGSGSCKIRSAFGGDADHKSSSDSTTFRC